MKSWTHIFMYPIFRKKKHFYFSFPTFQKKTTFSFFQFLKNEKNVFYFSAFSIFREKTFICFSNFPENSIYLQKAKNLEKFRARKFYRHEKTTEWMEKKLKMKTGFHSLFLPRTVNSNVVAW